MVINSIQHDRKQTIGVIQATPVELRAESKFQSLTAVFLGMAKALSRLQKDIQRLNALIAIHRKESSTCS